MQDNFYSDHELGTLIFLCCTSEAMVFRATSLAMCHTYSPSRVVERFMMVLAGPRDGFFLFFLWTGGSM